MLRPDAVSTSGSQERRVFHKVTAEGASQKGLMDNTTDSQSYITMTTRQPAHASARINDLIAKGWKVLGKQQHDPSDMFFILGWAGDRETAYVPEWLARELSSKPTPTRVLRNTWLRFESGQRRQESRARSRRR